MCKVKYRLGERRALCDPHARAAVSCAQERRYLSIGVADEQRRTARRGDAVKFARDDEVFHLGTKRDEMHIRHRQALGETVPGLQRFQHHIVEGKLSDLGFDPRTSEAAADEQESNVPTVL